MEGTDMPVLEEPRNVRRGKWLGKGVEMRRGRQSRGRVTPCLLRSPGSARRPGGILKRPWTGYKSMLAQELMVLVSKLQVFLFE